MNFTASANFTELAGSDCVTHRLLCARVIRMKHMVSGFDTYQELAASVTLLLIHFVA
jgi:hypothetical protein